MRWIYDACGNADLEEVALAGMGISAILEHVDLSSGRLARELAEATVSHAQAEDDEPER